MIMTMTLALKQRIVKKIQEHYQIDFQFYFHTIKWSSLAHVSTIIRGASTTFLMTRLLSIQTFGEFRYLLVLFGLAGSFSLSGISTGIIKGIAQGDTSIVRTGIKKMFLTSFLGSFLLVLFSGYKLFRQDVPLSIHAGLLAILFPLYSICGVFQPILIGKQSIRKGYQLTTIVNLIYAVLFTVLLIYTKKLSYLITGYFLIEILLKGVISIREVKNTSHRGDSREHMRLVSHISLINIAQGIIFQLDQILVQHFFGYTSLAKFNIAILIPDQLKDLLTSFSSVMLRRFSTYKNPKQVLQNTQKHYWAVFALCILITGSYALSAPVVLRYLFPQYQDQSFLTSIYAMSLICLASVVGANFFQAHNMMKRLWVFYGFNTVIQVVGTFVLIPFYGGAGAIYTKIASRILSMPLGYPRVTADKHR